MSAWMLIGLILLPLLSATVVGFLRNTWSKTTVSWVACGSVFAAFGLTVYLTYELFTAGAPITAPLTSLGPVLPKFGLLFDNLSAWWMIVVTGCGALIHLYSTGYMVDDPSYGRFMAKLNYFIFAMSLLVLADNFAGLLMGWANVGLASYMLIGFYIQKPAAGAAAMKAFIMNMVGEAGMILGIALIYMTFGDLTYNGVFEGLRAGKGLEAANLIGILLLVAALAKSAQLPLHTWLPNAMEGPTPVSALIHAATMVTAGVYLVSRAWPLYSVAAEASAWVAWLGGLGALFGAIVACGQMDIKRVLAFSTLSQIGYMFLGNGLGAYVAADFHFLTHAFFKAALFLTAGIVVHHYNGDQDIRRMGGAWAKDRFAGAVFAVGALALVGVFPFAGFFSKDEILLAAFHENFALFVVGLAAAALTAFYNVRLFSLVFLGNPYVAPVQQVGKRKTARVHIDAHAHAHHGTPAAMKLSVAILAALSVAGGWIFFPHWQLSFLNPTYANAFVAESIHLGIAITAHAVALISGVVAYYLYGPNGVRREAERDTAATGGLLLNMLYVDALYDRAVVRPALAVSSFASTFGDGRVIDGFVDGLGSAAANAGASLRTLQNGLIRRYAVYVFGGLVVILAYYMVFI